MNTFNLRHKNMLIKFFIRILIISGLLLVSQSVFSTEINISGVVKDKSGNQLPGVNVSIKETTISTITDAEGKYNINCSVGDVLMFSYAGLKPKFEKIYDNPVINVTWQMFDKKTIGALLGIVIVSGGWLLIYSMIF
jgi:hypothetical protein